MPATLRAIVLAAGQGRRLQAVTGGLPKQFWAPAGQPTLLEQTLQRLRPLTPARGVTTVVDASQEAAARAIDAGGRLGRLIVQPRDRGTAAGVLLGLSDVVEQAPDAIVVLTPSDHGIARPDQFLAGLRRAVAEVMRHERSLVVCGVEATAAATDYGWIVPEQGPGRRGELARVAAFLEKPPPALARRLLEAGGVWNTMVMAARVTRLLEVFAAHAPTWSRVFARARALERRTRAVYLREQYDTLAPLDFSRDIVTHAEHLRLLVWPREIGWTDLGTPDRLHAWHAGRQSAAEAVGA